MCLSRRGCRALAQGYRHLDLLSCTQEGERYLLARLSLLQEGLPVLCLAHRLAAHSNDVVVSNQQALSIDQELLTTPQASLVR